MRRLSGTDSLFLAGETPAWHQHVAGLAVVDPADAPGFGFDAVKKTVEERLPLVPKFMWKLREVPLGLDRAVWVDDAELRHRPPHPPRHVPRRAVPRDGRGRRGDDPRHASSTVASRCGSSGISTVSSTVASAW